MKKLTIALAILLTALLTVSPAAAQPRLERGKDFTEAPAIGGGLYLHNLFQPANELIKALRAADLERRIAVAKSLLKEPQK